MQSAKNEILKIKFKDKKKDNSEERDVENTTFPLQQPAKVPLTGFEYDFDFNLNKDKYKLKKKQQHASKAKASGP